MSRVIRTVGTSGANTAQTVSTPAIGESQQLLFYTVKYSAAPTQTGVVGTLNSGAGAGYDAALNTGSANALTTVYLPDGVVILAPDDVLDVLAPAAGGAVTSAVAIYTRPA